MSVFGRWYGQNALPWWRLPWEGVLSLVYPRICAACGSYLSLGVNTICIRCQTGLPRTSAHLSPTNNAITERFWGRVELRAAVACFRYVKDSPVQAMVHRLKYKGHPEVGVRVGQLYGATLRDVPELSQLDAIVPVPLHPRRLRERGYNQAERFGVGLSSAMGVPVWPNALRRTRFTATQTQKSRSERIANTDDAFEVTDVRLLEGKYLLLVDDVITTGATLEACARVMAGVQGTQVAVAAMAIADG